MTFALDSYDDGPNPSSVSPRFLSWHPVDETDIDGQAVSEDLNW